MSNKEILSKANNAFRQGKYDEFLTFCTDNTKWVYVGDREVIGKDKLREYITTAYEESTFTEDNFIEESDYLTVLGKIRQKNKQGELITYSYCDVWKFHKGKIAELKAFLIAD